MSYNNSDQPRQQRSRRVYSEQEAMNKIYLIKTCGHASRGYLNVPKALIGKRVKLIEVKQTKEE